MPQGTYKRTKPVWNKGIKTGIKPWLGKHRSQETKDKLRKANLGKKQSEEHIRKKGESMKRWHQETGFSEETKRKIGLANKGKLLGTKLPQETKDKISKNNAKYWLGKKLTQETRNKLSESHKGYIMPLEQRKKIGKQKEKHWNWQGGITPINNTVRGSLEYKLWSDSVWNKDGNCCQKCGEERLCNLVAHHILNFSSYLELRFAIDNGITFCRKCHNWFHRKYGKQNNSKEQVENFIKNN